MSSDVDVAAIRNALAESGEKHESWVVVTSHQGTPTIEARYPDDENSKGSVARVCSHDDANLIVLLRNNIEALLEDLGYAQLAAERWRDMARGVFIEDDNEDDPAKFDPGLAAAYRRRRRFSGGGWEKKQLS